MRSPSAQRPLVPRPAPAPAVERRAAVKLDAPAPLPSSSSFDLDWSDVDVNEEPLETSQRAAEPAPPARAAPPAPPRAPAPPAPAPPLTVKYVTPADEGLSPAESAVALSAAEPGLSSALEDTVGPIPSAEVVPLEDLDFGESPFAAPPRSAVPAPEAEPVELPMLEAEEEIELTPVGELTPGTAETGFQPAPPSPPAMSEPPLASEPAPTTVAEWMVAHGLSEIAPPRETREPDVAPARPPSDGGEAQLREALSGASREVIERIAWEVVPQLAETIIREQVDRLVLDRVVKERLAKERLG